MKPTVMISEVKFFSKRVNAFSLLEILIALVIVGVVISFPNWQSLITRLGVNNSAIKKELELKVLTSIVEQSGLPVSSAVRVSLPAECGQSFVEIGVGGIVSATQFQCNGRPFRITKSGRVIAQ